MKLLSVLSPKSIAFLTLSLTLLIASCGNPAGSDDEDHDHDTHAEGAVLVVDNEEVVHYWDGEVTGNLEVASGEETPLVTLYFLDEEGERFHPEDSHFSLDWSNIDTAIAELEQPEEDGRWSFHLIGIAPGTTSVELHMWHEDADHADFSTPGIPIRVN